VNKIKLVKIGLKMLKTPQGKKTIFKTEVNGQESGKKNRESRDRDIQNIKPKR